LLDPDRLRSIGPKLLLCHHTPIRFGKDNPVAVAVRRARLSRNRRMLNPHKPCAKPPSGAQTDHTNRGVAPC
jgi:hypothetical protein